LFEEDGWNGEKQMTTNIYCVHYPAISPQTKIVKNSTSHAIPTIDSYIYIYIYYILYIYTIYIYIFVLSFGVSRVFLHLKPQFPIDSHDSQGVLNNFNFNQAISLRFLPQKLAFLQGQVTKR